MIEVLNIARTVNGKELFSNISISIKSKSITGLLGANGAGKTSLFRAIAVLSKIDTGKLTFFGEDMTGLSLEERSKLGLSYVPQENSLFEELSLNENIRLAMELKFKKIMPSKEKKIDEFFMKMGLVARGETKAKYLSGGEKRKAEILRSILLDAKVILLDEPFAGVDPISVDEINKILKKLSKEISIFISDHNFRDVINVCDSIILMNQGKILSTGSPEEISRDPLAKKFYFGE
ncbi:MAG: ATP-binding cassette domain-containing protein [Proteobacteria bacterium]|nr:ATP-binding cassette domain-containing protein [Pseudomonadota bacterium]